MDIKNLLEIMRRLRDPESGCPWDRRQSFESIAPYTIEEAYEVADAIEREALDELADELGDLLFQVVYHARMAEEIGAFDFDDVTRRICEKMWRRHPHVFGEPDRHGRRPEAPDWETLKNDEQAAHRRERGDTEKQALLDGIPMGLPALTRAVKLGKRAAGVGFDWPSLAPVRAKLDEELGELDEAIASGDRDACIAELGDLLFAAGNLARHLRIDPETALRSSNARFARRFAYVERAVDRSGGNWEEFDLARLDGLWEAAKASLGQDE